MFYFENVIPAPVSCTKRIAVKLHFMARWFSLASSILSITLVE